VVNRPGPRAGEAPPPLPLVQTRIDEVVRAEWPRVLATLVQDLGNLADAEDAVQDAALEALRQWSIEGIPDRPGAWITTVARRRAVDRARRQVRGRQKAEQLASLEARLAQSGEHTMDTALEPSLLDDEQLRLMFACCHPALSVEAQMALTLRCLAGLTTAEIARAFLVAETTIAQRLVRAKRKMAAAAIPFHIPPDQALLERTGLVRTIVYLLFNEGYEATGDNEVVRVDLCREALRLAELVARLTPDDAESLGLAALLSFIHARAGARTDGNGDLVLLADQDRSRWERPLIELGHHHLNRALRLERPGPLQLQAAIQALHCDAAESGSTDWAQIELLYRRLRTFTDSEVVQLNHAVALSLAGQPGDALNLLDEEQLAQRLDGYSHYHSARAELLRQSQPVEARRAYQRALDTTANEAIRRFLRRRLDSLGEADGAT
jgi:RNA polymerase sigma-70 factor, ECF subfamily